ncbi:hypothetical protein [Bacillus sp. NTK034]|uniref:hypothetical protein n=1 Tax=Bacillus sp. NTK034 TaxID=2802176 RepID=UPI001A90170B|nr:hypothetical protein [Bacillus sp. NTK034]MBN8204063.1 hypothetical protein [Bacillus sp. NTK034]
MFWTIINILIAVYIIYSLSSIKYQLKLISEHLNVNGREIEKVSNDEIERELKDI